MGANPFVQAFVQADWFGQILFIGLYLLSIISWAIALGRMWSLRSDRMRAAHFRARFEQHFDTPLSLELPDPSRYLDPLAAIYYPVRKQILLLLNRNRAAEPSDIPSPGHLTDRDFDTVAAKIGASAQNQCLLLRRHLSTLAMCVTLAPFLGLLGTVWGILLSFGSLQNQSGLSTERVLEGLSLALTTTVVGLVIAIVALIGHTIVKQLIAGLESQIEQFAEQLLTSFELRYRKVV